MYFLPFHPVYSMEYQCQQSIQLFFSLNSLCLCVCLFFFWFIFAFPNKCEYIFKYLVFNNPKQPSKLYLITLSISLIDNLILVQITLQKYAAIYLYHLFSKKFRLEKILCYGVIEIMYFTSFSSEHVQQVVDFRMDIFIPL